MQCYSVALAARNAGVVLTALVLMLVSVETAPASGSDTRADHMRIPSAGWDGRPIQEPHQHDVIRTSTVQSRPMQGWSAGPVSLGTGFHKPGGSARVREVQRRLSRLGYHVGPIDGLFGRLTKASVAWFQFKHGLEVDGRATFETVRHLRARTGAGGGRVTEGAKPGAVSQDDSGTSRPEAWEAFNQLVGPTPAVGEPTSARETRPFAHSVLLALVSMALTLLIALLVQQIARRARRAREGRTRTDAAPTMATAIEQQRLATDRQRARLKLASSDDGPPGRIAAGARFERWGRGDE